MAMVVATVAAMASDPAISRAATGDSLTSTTIAMVQGQVVEVAAAVLVLVEWAVPARAVMEALAAVAATGYQQVKASIMAGHTIVIRTSQPTNTVGSLVQSKHP